MTACKITHSGSRKNATSFNRSVMITSQKHEPLNLLLVDDEVSIIQSLKRSLRTSNFHIFTALNGQEAQHILETYPIHIVVTDLSMPIMDGYALLEHISKEHPAIVSVLLTAQGELHTIKKAINFGNILFFLEKPWVPEELNSILFNARKRILYKLNQKQKMQTVGQLARKLNQQNRKLKEVIHLKSFENKNKVFVGKDTQLFLQGLNRIVDVSPHTDNSFAQNVAYLACKIGLELQLTQKDLSILAAASKLCEIGLVGTALNLANHSIKSLNHHQYKRYRDQVHVANKLLTVKANGYVTTLRKVIVNQFRDIQYFDDYEIDNIARMSFIMALSRDYCLYKTGRMTGRSENHKTIIAQLKQQFTRRHPQLILNAAYKVFDNEQFSMHITGAFVNELKVGMELKENLYSEKSVLLIPKGHLLTEKNIEQLEKIEINSACPLRLCV